MGAHCPTAASFANVIFSDRAPRSRRSIYRNPACSFSCKIQRTCQYLGLMIQSKIGTEPTEATGSLCLPKSTTEFCVSWSKPFTGTEPPGKWKAKLIKQQLNTSSFLDLPLQQLYGFRALPQKAGTWTTKVFTPNLIWLSSPAISSCLCFCGPPALTAAAARPCCLEKNQTIISGNLFPSKNIHLSLRPSTSSPRCTAVEGLSRSQSSLLSSSIVHHCKSFMSARFPDISPVCVSSGNPCLESQIKEHTHIKPPQFIQNSQQKHISCRRKGYLLDSEDSCLSGGFPCNPSSTVVSENKQYLGSGG